MEDEKYQLDNWNRKDIYPKDKKLSIAQLVIETILTLRCNLITKRIEQLKEDISEPNQESKVVLQEIMQYQELLGNLSKRLNRVVVV
jgi:DNA primase